MFNWEKCESGHRLCQDPQINLNLETKKLDKLPSECLQSHPRTTHANPCSRIIYLMTLPVTEVTVLSTWPLYTASLEAKPSLITRFLQHQQGAY
jgi:hypothetical protein